MLMLTTEAADFVSLMENSTVSEGNLQVCYDVSIKDDSEIEQLESFYATLTALPGPIQGLGIINPSQSSVFIVDNDGNTKYIMQPYFLSNSNELPQHRTSSWF